MLVSGCYPLSVCLGGEFDKQGATSNDGHVVIVDYTSPRVSEAFLVIAEDRHCRF